MKRGPQTPDPGQTDRGDRHTQDHDSDCGRHHDPATAPLPSGADGTTQVNIRGRSKVGRSVHQRSQAVIVIHHSSIPLGANSRRIAASASEVWLFTVPVERLKAEADCSTDMSHKNRSTNTARCRAGS